MTSFILVYLGGAQPSDPEEGKAHFDKYRAWLGSLGDALISPANPLKDTTVITPGGTVTPGSITEMSGFTVIQAESIQDAIKMARTCPFLEIGGTLEVSELVHINSPDPDPTSH